MILGLIKLLRPTQWTKNLLCYGGALFAGVLFYKATFLVATQAVLLFCLASSGTYIFNDIVDRKRDRQHPRKRFRPTASGEVPIIVAMIVAIVLIAMALLWAHRLDERASLCVGIYIVISLLYSLHLKDVALLNVVCIAMGVVLRLLVGAYVLSYVVGGVVPNTWVVLCSFFLGIFFGFAKRRAEYSSTREGDSTLRAGGGEITAPRRSSSSVTACSPQMAIKTRR